MLAHPELQPYMKPELRAAMDRQIAIIVPATEATAAATDEDDKALANVDATYSQSRDTIMWIHHGARFLYWRYPEELAKLAPLRLGADAAEDLVRLVTLQRLVPTLKPAFIWLSDEGLSLAALGKQIKAHRDAQALEPTLGLGEKSALAILRNARPASEALWSNEGGRLDAWIIANVPESKHFAFGRERRQRARTAVAKTPEQSPPTDKPKDPATDKPK